MSRQAARLQAVFETIATTRMADVPILNPALRVETVGFRLWQGYWIGVLVTPWTLSLVVMPGELTTLEPLLADEKRTWSFPSGAYAFMGLNEPELGVCHICSLISPVSEFATHAAAISVANEIVSQLFSENADSGEFSKSVEQARIEGESIARKQVSRRDFLRMRLLGP